MSFFDTMREPVILKEDSDAKKQLEQLEFYMKMAPQSIKAEIEQDIKRVKNGIYGEDALMFELKNSHIPMYILHDVFFENNGLKTQIDYIIVTRKLILIIECKNLYGNITVDNQGNFIRAVHNGRNYVKEGIYSPITQNQRHLDMIKEKRRAAVGFFDKLSFEKSFERCYKSVVVIANPKTVIDMRYARREVKEHIVRVDGLNAYIKRLNDECGNASMSDKNMLALARFFLDNCGVNTADYTEKYRQAVENSISSLSQNSTENIEEALASENKVAMTSAEQPKDITNTPVYKALRDFRYKQSQKERIKPYFIFNNAQLEEIIRLNPKTLDDLKKVNGFGDVKCVKYGKDIILILGDFCR